MKRFLAIVFCLVGLSMSQVANATTISYDLTSDHCTGGCGSPGNTLFGTVTLTDVPGGGGVEITVMLNNGNKFVNTGFPGAVAFNLIGNPTITESPDTSGWSLFSSSAGNLSFDGFGQFEYAIVCDICGTGASNAQAGPLVFTVTGAGLTVGSFAELSTNPPGDSPAYFGVDIISGTTGNTGLVDATTTVPDGGSTVALLGSALLGLSMLRRRLGKR